MTYRSAVGGLVMYAVPIARPSGSSAASDPPDRPLGLSWPKKGVESQPVPVPSRVYLVPSPDDGRLMVMPSQKPSKLISTVLVGVAVAGMPPRAETVSAVAPSSAIRDNLIERSFCCRAGQPRVAASQLHSSGAPIWMRHVAAVEREREYRRCSYPPW